MGEGSGTITDPNIENERLVKIEKEQNVTSISCFYGEANDKSNNSIVRLGKSTMQSDTNQGIQNIEDTANKCLFSDNCFIRDMKTLKPCIPSLDPVKGRDKESFQIYQGKIQTTEYHHDMMRKSLRKKGLSYDDLNALYIRNGWKYDQKDLQYFCRRDGAMICCSTTFGTSCLNQVMKHLNGKRHLNSRGSV